MNPLHEPDLARQQARAWSEHLGALAAASPATRPGRAFAQPDAPPSALSTRLATLLSHFRQRSQMREHAACVASALVMAKTLGSSRAPRSSDVMLKERRKPSAAI